MSGYEPADNPYDSPNAAGTPVRRNTSTWIIVAVVAAVMLFGMLACGGLVMAYVSLQATRQAQMLQKQAMQAEQQAREAETQLQRALEEAQQDAAELRE